MTDLPSTSSGHQRVSQLWTIASAMFVPNPTLSRFYVLQMRKVATDLGLCTVFQSSLTYLILALPNEILDNICEACSSIMVPGVNSHTRVKDTGIRERADRVESGKGTVNDALLKHVKAKEKKAKKRRSALPATTLGRYCEVCRHTSHTQGTLVGALTKKLTSWKLKEEHEHRHVELPNVPKAEITNDFISLSVKLPAWQLAQSDTVLKGREPGTAGGAKVFKHRVDGSLKSPREEKRAAGGVVGQKRGGEPIGNDMRADKKQSLGGKSGASGQQFTSPPPRQSPKTPVAGKTPGTSKTPVGAKTPLPAASPATPLGTPGAKKNSLKSILMKEEQKKASQKGSGSLYDFLSSLGPSPS